MSELLKKELRLAASPLSYWFLAFALMTMIPGYPILVGGFFVCLGLFQSFQNAREQNDVIYTALLPVRKTDIVRAKVLNYAEAKPMFEAKPQRSLVNPRFRSLTMQR